MSVPLKYCKYKPANQITLYNNVTTLCCYSYIPSNNNKTNSLFIHFNDKKVYDDESMNPCENRNNAYLVKFMIHSQKK